MCNLELPLEDTLEVLVSVVQVENMLHALGLDKRGYIKPNVRRRPLPRAYRNHFAIKFDENWEDLIAKGLALKANSIGINHYIVTERGIAYLKKIGYKFIEE